MKRLQGWDSYVANARQEPVELPVGDEVFTIQQPNRSQLKAFNQARREGDDDGAVIALLGEQAGRRVAELAQDQPSDALETLLLDVMNEFGIYMVGGGKRSGDTPSSTDVELSSTSTSGSST